MKFTKINGSLNKKLDKKLLGTNDEEDKDNLKEIGKKVVSVSKLLGTKAKGK